MFLLASATGLLGLAWFLNQTPQRTDFREASTDPLLVSGVRKLATKPGAAPRRASREEQWQDFKERFGSGFDPVFTPGGRLVQIKQGAGSRVKPASAFSPRNAAQVLARAQEILDALSGPLGIDPDFPLGEPRYNLGEVSAQVSFQETQNGVPLEPYGDVQLSLGMEGELLSLNSQYIASPRVTNDVSLNEDEARSKVIASGIGAGEPGSLAFGTMSRGRVVWIRQAASDGPSDARQAYSYSHNGWDVIVDASSGAILSQRNRRHF